MDAFITKIDEAIAQLDKKNDESSEFTTEEEEEVEVEEEAVLSAAENLEEEEVEEEEVVSEAEDTEEEISDEEEVVAVVNLDVVAENLEEDEEVFEIEIDDVTYFATHEENGILYEVDENGEPGKKVGIIKDGEPIFS